MTDRDSLATFPYVVVRLGCRQCKRTGAYRLARLAAKYGAEITMPELLDRLAADCPYRFDRKPRKYSANCVARFVDLDDPRPPPDLPPAVGARKLRLVAKKVSHGSGDVLRGPTVRPRQ